MKKVLFVASVVKIHIMVFHIPYLKWFHENGYEVHVAAQNDYDNPTELSIPYCDKFHDISFNRNPFTIDNIKAYNNLLSLYEKENFDVIHCHTPIGATIARLAYKNSIKKNATIFYTAHGFHFYKGSSKVNWLIYYPIEYYLSKYTDVLITMNEEDYQNSLKMRAVNNIKVPGVGFDLENIEKIKNNPVKLDRRDFNINDNDFLILSVGETNKNKNHEIVIKALKYVNKKNIKYIICGEGPEMDNLLELVNRLDLGSQVHFAGFRSDVLKFYSFADLFVFPSFREGLSVSLMEAMAFGLPVLASNVRGNRDLIEDCKGGYLFDPSNDKALAHLIEKIIECHDLQTKFGIFNQKKIKDYSIERIVEIMGEVYNNHGV